MKSNSFLYLVCLIFVFSFFETAEIKAQNNNGTNSLFFALSQEYTWDFYEKTGRYCHTNYEQFSQELIDVLKDKKTPNVNQCAAVYYLGKIRATEAANVLAERVGLQFDETRLPIEKHWVYWDIKKYPVVESLVEIGNPSLPAVLCNLAESDDAQVRKLSLQVIERIDNDKDISTLRLQKAIKAETDSQKQARLQAALKVLAETS